MLQGFECTFTTQPVEAPKQQHVKLALTGVPEHALKSGAIRVFACD
jgi:hypothetical protein